MKVRIPRSFAAERRYIVDVLLGEFLGLSYTVEPSDGRDYTIEIGPRTLTIRDHFFSGLASYLDVANIPATVPTVPNPFDPGHTLVALFGDDELVLDGPEVRCGVDVFASAFFMLTRWEETVATAHDIHGRFLAAHSLAQRAGFLQRCVVNEWTELLWGLLGRIGCTQPRRVRSFTVSASHDIDYPWHWTPRTSVVTFAGDLLKRRSPRRALATAREVASVATRRTLDPYDTFDWLMDRSEEHGITSTFNFMTGRWTEHDPPFEFRPHKLAPILARIHRRGHTIGFHPSYNAYADASLWKLEWERLSSISPQPVTSGREHYLRFAAPETWQIWNDQGMEWDSTLGYADHEGFRCGTCYAYPVFNVRTGKQLALRERPLIAMDTTLVGYRKLSPMAASDALTALRTECRKYGGDLMLLWHNSNLSGEWAAYRSVYSEALHG